MMLKANYPGFKEHKIEHENLTNKVIEFQRSFKKGESLISMDLMVFLKDWLLNHIEGTDKKYKDKLS